MPVNPRDIIDKHDDPDYLREFIDGAETATTKSINKSTVASMVFLGLSLRRAADASEEHARGLKWATWCLAAATVALVVVALAQLFAE